jgi:general secretion pathway protein H
MEPEGGQKTGGPDRFNRAGFTLIELMVVVVLISMVLLLVIPKLPSSDQENLKISARTLAATLRYLQERAPATGTAYYLDFAPGTESLRILQVGGDGGGKEPTDPFLQKPPLKEGIVVADVRIPRLGKISDGQLRVDVGVAGIRDFIAIHLRSTGGTYWTVMAYPSGCKVTYYEGYLEAPP